MSSRIKAAILGASGYTGQELARLLLAHPGVELTKVTSRRYAGEPLSQVYPSLRGMTDIRFVHETAAKVAMGTDVVFLALPHQISQDAVGEIVLQNKKAKMIDLSADFRLTNAALYEEWYTKHTQKELLGSFVYGLPELFRQDIVGATRVSNPGCYPTSALLGMAPLVKAALVRNDSVVINSCSGVSGAGREPLIGSLFCEVSQGFKAYKVGGVHRHTPEIEQGLSRLAGTEVRVTFTPHLLPVNRGILSTIYASLVRPTDVRELHGCFADFYRDEEFVRICPVGNLPNISAVTGTNFCDIGLAVDTRTNRAIIIAAIDNLVKGAAGQAVQNMNIIFALPEAQGLGGASVFP